MQLIELNANYKHVKIREHPNINNLFLVLNKTFPNWPPFVGSFDECIKKAAEMEMKSEAKLEERKQLEGKK